MSKERLIRFIFGLLLSVIVCLISVFKEDLNDILTTNYCNSQEEVSVQRAMQVVLSELGIDNQELLDDVLSLSGFFESNFFRDTFNKVKRLNKKDDEQLNVDVFVNRDNYLDYFYNGGEFLEWLIISMQKKFVNMSFGKNNIDDVKNNISELYLKLSQISEEKSDFKKSKYNYIGILGSEYSFMKRRVDFVFDKVKHMKHRPILLTTSRIIDISKIDKDDNGKLLHSFVDVDARHNGKEDDADIAYFIIENEFLSNQLKSSFNDDEEKENFIEYLTVNYMLNDKKRSITEMDLAKYMIKNDSYKKFSIKILNTAIKDPYGTDFCTREILNNFFRHIRRYGESNYAFFKRLKKRNIVFITSKPFYEVKQEHLKDVLYTIFGNDIDHKELDDFVESGIEIVICPNVLSNNEESIRQYLRVLADTLYIKYEDTSKLLRKYDKTLQMKDKRIFKM